MYLLASTLLGGLYLLILFGLCLGGVVGFKHFRRSLRNARENPPEEKTQPPQQNTPAPAPKEVYYIVEKKRARSKPSFSQPKKIHFE